jgi:hypothetical protein
MASLGAVPVPSLAAITMPFEAASAAMAHPLLVSVPSFHP